MKLISRTNFKGQWRLRLWVWYVIACSLQVLDLLIAVTTFCRLTGNFGIWWCAYSKLAEKLEAV